jgi:NADH:ubiquinone oxidoreductase subunit 6 (subunit J)
MTGQQIIFLILAVFTTGVSLMVVIDRNLFRAAIALMASFLGVAGMYVLLEAGFLAAAQLLVYIGAISILLIFAIMMTRRLMQTTESPFNSQPWWGFAAAALTLILLVMVIVQTWPAEIFSAAPDVRPDLLRGSVADLGALLVDPGGYVLAFELASVLLLAALVGAIVIARPEEDE